MGDKNLAASELQHARLGKLFNRSRLTPKHRRLHFMKARYMKFNCFECGATAHYKLNEQSQSYYCRIHLPESGWVRLSLEWQTKHIVRPIAEYIDRVK